MYKSDIKIIQPYTHIVVWITEIYMYNVCHLIVAITYNGT